MNNSTSLSFDISILKKFLKQQFNQKEIHRLAKSTKLIQRSTNKINGLELVKSLLESALDPMSYPLEGLCDTIARINPEARMSKQALSQKINSPECVNFFELIYSNFLTLGFKTILPNLLSKNEKSLLKLFNKIIVMDSTEFPLDPSLKNDFKGTGGPEENASAMKICLAYEAKTKSILSTDITDRKCPDQILGEKIFTHLRKGDLVLFDLGFFSGKTFEKILGLGAFFISLLHGSSNIYAKEDTDNYLEIGKYLERKCKKANFVDENLFMNKQKIPVRLVAFKLDKKISDKRIKDYKKRCRKDKRQPSKENLTRLKYAIFITNVSQDILTPKHIRCIYKIRWQIELIFKNWKSQLNLSYIPGKDLFRIKTLIISRLIAIYIIWATSGYIHKSLEINNAEELSLQKSINWLKHDNRFVKILQGRVEKVMSEFLLAGQTWLHKEKSLKKRTTHQLLTLEDELVMNF